MAIVCGTDLSEYAAQATLAAALLARRLREPLTLVHALGTEQSTEPSADEGIREQVRRQAEELRARFAIEVEPLVLAGPVHQVLLETAAAARARFLVISSQGNQKPRRWLFGSTAERVTQTSSLPVLVVRDASAIRAWVDGERALRIMVGVELSPSSKVALSWAAGLRDVAPCDLHVVQLVSPVAEHLRTGVPFAEGVDLADEVREVLDRDLRAWAGELRGAGETVLSVEICEERFGSHLAQRAASEQVDLLVTGARQRSVVSRLWLGSVSRAALAEAPCNVACVPAQSAGEAEVHVPTFRQVLVPTDFSGLANRAIAVGYALAAPGGVVYLLHVSAARDQTPEAELTARLRALIPPGAAAKGIATEIVLAQDESAATGIWQAAERLGVDVLCMGTHGRTGATRLLMGSAAGAVLQRVRRPVMMVPPEPELGAPST